MMMMMMMMVMMTMNQMSGLENKNNYAHVKFIKNELMCSRKKSNNGLNDAR